MRSFFLFLLCTLVTFGAFAQKSKRSTLHIRLSDGQPLVVTINDRDYKKVNTRITIADIPGKRPHIRAYRFRPYADGNGGKAELVYSGTIRIAPGSSYDCIVDLKSGKLLVKDIGPGNSPAAPAYMPPPPPPVPDAASDVAIDNSVNMDARLLQLHQKISNIVGLPIPQRLWDLLLLFSEIEAAQRWVDLPAKQLNKLAKNVTALEMKVSGKTTFKEEFVTAGGIELAEVDSQTMQSKKHPGLYFAGEILNIDGITGGFNFQNAWTTAWIAAQSISTQV